MMDRAPAADPGQQAQQLIGAIDAGTEAEIEAIIAAARKEAGAIVADAHRVARARMGELLPRLRQERATALAQQQARIDADARRREQERAARLVAAGRQQLVPALAARWRDETARHRWLDAAFAVAGRFLRPGNWHIEVAPGVPDDDRERLAQQAERRHASRLDWREDSTMAAGLRLSSEGAVLDATPAGLLADASAIDAALLAALDRRRPATGEAGA
jgi:F0F1-type ATP synthase membrane subunit b/b'